MKKRLQKVWGVLVIFVSILATTWYIAAPQAMAIDVFGEACNQGGANNAVCESRGDDAWGLLDNIISTLLLLIGVVSVIYIIIGGYRYITANGEASKISGAKNTIMYAVIGLVIAIAAYAIVAFVISRI